MIDGENYFRGQHDILHRKRTMIGANGKLETVDNLPNNRIVDNQYKKMVNQKVDYLVSQPLTLQTDNEQYSVIMKKFFDKRFLRLLKNVAQDSLNGGVGWLFLYYNDSGDFTFKRIKPYEIVAGWADEEHTILDYAIRICEVIAYEGRKEKVIQKVEVYHENGVNRFILDGSRLVPDEVPHEPYFTVTDENGEQAFNWSKIPLIPFKYNTEEIPLIRNVKSLQDGLNLIISNFQNNMEEDARNTILVLVNYGGENLGEFRKNLSTYGAVNVTTIDGEAGDLRTLQIEVNAENYKAILEVFKKAIIENAMGYDAKDDRMGGNANQLNIMSMYSDIDLDANEMETEYQASLEELIYFVNFHLANVGAGDFEQERLDIIFNRNMLISESEVITNIQNSTGILSDETLVANHPWIDDPQKELKRKKEEQAEAMERYGGVDAFNPAFHPGGDAVVTKNPQKGEESKE
jgi:SPP1 family phage portal protein